MNFHQPYINGDESFIGSLNKSHFLVTRTTPAMETRVDLRQAIEKEVLSYMVAVQYDKCRDKLANERATVFTPLPSAESGIIDPAANSCIALIDYNATDPVPQAGHYLISDVPTGKSNLYNWSCHGEICK